MKFFNKKLAKNSIKCPVAALSDVAFFLIIVLLKLWAIIDWSFVGVLLCVLLGMRSLGSILYTFSKDQKPSDGFMDTDK